MKLVNIFGIIYNEGSWEEVVELLKIQDTVSDKSMEKIS